MTRSSSTDTDIAIIGAGPTGLMLANLLGQRGVRTTLLERRETPFTEPRAIAYDPETLRLFQTVGCFEDLADTLELDVPVLYVNASGKTLAHITDCPPSFGHSGRGTYYQPELEQALVNGLSRRDSVTLRRGVDVEHVDLSAEQAHLTLKRTGEEAETLTAKFVVDCSGGASRIRKQLGVSFSGDTFKEKWLVIDVQGDDYEGREIRFFCDPKRPAVTLPVSKNRRRWEFLVMPGDDETELPSEARARELMRGYGAGEADRIERSLVYTFHARFADQFRVERVFFAGDSAHVMPPFAGQGLNSGMRDAANLAWKLAGVLDGRFGDEILDTYDPERRPHVEDMTKLTIRLGRTIMPTNSVRAWFRDRAMLTAWRFPGTRKKFNRGDLIPKPSIERSGLVKWDRGRDVGMMIDQPVIAGTKLDERLGSGFAVIGLNCQPADVLSAQDRDILRQLNASFVSISSQDIERSECEHRQGLFDRSELKKPAVMVVRPDRFIADAFTPDSTVNQLDWMRNAYGLRER